MTACIFNRRITRQKNDNDELRGEHDKREQELVTIQQKHELLVVQYQQQMQAKQHDFETGLQKKDSEWEVKLRSLEIASENQESCIYPFCKCSHTWQ
jgi:septal ring factor EnvC (AmiA/AmiB activator)